MSNLVVSNISDGTTSVALAMSSMGRLRRGLILMALLRFLFGIVITFLGWLIMELVAIP